MGHFDSRQTITDEPVLTDLAKSECAERWS